MESVEKSIFNDFVKKTFGEDFDNGLSPESKEILIAKSHILKLDKGEFLQIEGDISKYWGYVSSGLVRVYYMHNGEEITEQLAIDGDGFFDCESFFKQTPSDRFIQMLEPTTLYLFRRMEYGEVIMQNPEIRRFFRYLTEMILLMKKKRTLDSIFQSAKERYETLLAEKPNLVLRAPSNIIASYLGITPETLSRIKSKKK